MISRIPRTFEIAFFIFLVLFWLANSATEKTSLGRILMGYKSELYPMSTFSVYLSPKLRQASKFEFEVVPQGGGKAVKMSAYDMFYPLEPPNLDDEIATNQMFFLLESVSSQCATYQTRNFGRCERNPSPVFTLPKDMGDMWLKSVQKRLGWEKVPEKIVVKRVIYPFNPEDLSQPITQTREQTYMVFYPAKNWVAHGT